MAQATGGQAFYNNNGLNEITEHVLDSDGSFYTLTYSPSNLYFDKKWHQVRVEVGGASYHLSYRSGYFADGSVREKDQNTGPRTRLLWNGEKLQVSELRDRPMSFARAYCLHPILQLPVWTRFRAYWRCIRSKRDQCPS